MSEMQVKKQSVKKFLQRENTTFLIPNYQRQYNWGETQCTKMWEDITDYFKSEADKNSEPYFLGTIVSCRDEDDNAEYEYDDDSPRELQVIDGQQRITTISLLFRALYEKIEKIIKATDNDNESIQGYVFAFGRCLWSFNEGSGKLNFDKPLLSSEVATEDQKAVLKKILSKDFKMEELSEDEKKSRYAENYAFFQKQIGDFNIFEWGKFFDVVLNKLMVLPIECKSQDSALRIFTTLNDRGTPLSDSDVFKGILYSKFAKESKEKSKAFADAWKKLESAIAIEKDDSREGELFSINFLFAQYMHVLRAKKGDNGKEIALRKFFTHKGENNKNRLENDHNQVFADIQELSELWLTLHDLTQKTEHKNNLNENNKACQYFDILFHYPNEYWKYLTSAFYFWCKEKSINFYDDAILLPFLKKIIAYLFVRFLERPGVNYIKDSIFSAYTDLYKSDEPCIKFPQKLTDDLKNFLNINDKPDADITKKAKNTLSNAIYKSKLTSSLLALYMYLEFPNQKIVERKDREIEHIFPRRWQKNIHNWSDEDARMLVENLGNKMFLENALNIQANNNFFGRKKDRYKHSQYDEARTLGENDKTDWLKEDILGRENKIFTQIYKFFQENI